jgi:hypothetical protein
MVKLTSLHFYVNYKRCDRRISKELLIVWDAVIRVLIHTNCSPIKLRQRNKNKTKTKSEEICYSEKLIEQIFNLVLKLMKQTPGTLQGQHEAVEAH